MKFEESQSKQVTSPSHDLANATAALKNVNVFLKSREDERVTNLLSAIVTRLEAVTSRVRELEKDNSDERS